MDAEIIFLSTENPHERSKIELILCTLELDSEPEGRNEIGPPPPFGVFFFFYGR